MAAKTKTGIITTVDLLCLDTRILKALTWSFLGSYNVANILTTFQCQTGSSAGKIKIINKSIHYKKSPEHVISLNELSFICFSVEYFPINCHLNTILSKILDKFCKNWNIPWFGSTYQILGDICMRLVCSDRTSQSATS